MRPSSRHFRRGGAFSLVELIVTLAVAAILVALAASMMRQAWRSMDKAASISNLRQLGAAAILYAAENAGYYPPTLEVGQDGYYWWFGFESNDSRSLPEGMRILQPDKGPLAAYIQKLPENGGCPTFLHSATLKPKFSNSTGFGFGYNEVLGPHPWIWRNSPESRKTVSDIESPSGTILFSTSSQINTFQPPASRDNPMLEEFYFINENEFTIHFRFGGHAAAVMADGHVAMLEPDETTLVRKLPEENVGRLAPYGSFDYLK